jgi:putative transposase
VASTYLKLNIHIVFATKDRAPTIDARWRDDLHAYIGGTIRGLKGTALAVGGVADHVHVLAGIRATHSIADLVRELKKASSIWASERYERFAWQEGYGAFSVSASHVSVVTEYIRNQEQHHLQISSADELRALLAEFGVEYDERYFE